MTNNLINETSPYLLQHKNNPVNWYPWNSNTLSLIKNNNKPVLLSIGYSSCHWCHVMAHESFEDNNVASIMNSHFINIKVDREERPDIDALYQASLSLMGQQGGWPLTMFLDKNFVPFWGGTYFPNVRKHGLPSFSEVLNHINNIYKNNTLQIQNNASAVNAALQKIYYKSSTADYNKNDIFRLLQLINENFDPAYGGLLGSPKFPMTPLLKSLLYMSLYPNEKPSSSSQNILTTLVAICLGGIFDHVGGGFSRYSTDEQWLVPHFEKMLYDNAQLIEILSSLYFLHKNIIFKDRVEKTISWLGDTMLFTNPGSEAYFSAIDADSEGAEGSYYVWDYNHIVECLKDEGEIFAKQYGAEKTGNWENKNILHRINMGSKEDVVYEVSNENSNKLKILLKERALRPSPLIDTKILTDWNCMLICALLRAYIVFGNKEYLNKSKKVFSFILDKHFVGDKLYHSSCNGVLGPLGILDDYANLIRASFFLYEVEGDNKKLQLAKNLLGYVKSNFYDEKISDFYFTDKESNDLFLKTTNRLDNATPSGSGIMLENLIKGYYYFGDKEDFMLLDNIIKSNWKNTCSNPVANTGYIAAAYMKLVAYQFVILIKDDEFGNSVKNYLLNLSSFSVTTFFYNEKDVPQNSVIGKKGCINNKTTVYVCSGFVCSPPINNIEDMKSWVGENILFKNKK